MAKIIVNPKNAPNGEIEISGSKNSALPILAASVLCTEPCIIDNVPDLSDIRNMKELIKNTGLTLSINKNRYMSETAKEIFPFASYEMTNKLRGSFLIAGPLLAKTGYAKVAYPGGCHIGERPINLHLKGFTKLGADITNQNGYIEMKCERLKGAKIYLDFPSVGATENIMIAACTAKGVTVIENAAAEPEIEDLAVFLNKAGANVEGAGTPNIRINGVEKLFGCEHTVIPDRIEAGTYMIMAAASNGKIKLTNIICSHLRPVIEKLREAGISITERKNYITVEGRLRYNAVDIKTLPYPGFPTDLQAQFCAFLTRARGTGIVTETIFENRFSHIYEFKRMGADITVEGRSAVIEGVGRLSGAEMRASDLRAGAALITAALMADGKSVIEDNGYLDRGYCDIVGKLKSLGVDIEKDCSAVL